MEDGEICTHTLLSDGQGQEFEENHQDFTAEHGETAFHSIL